VNVIKKLADGNTFKCTCAGFPCFSQDVSRSEDGTRAVYECAVSGNVIGST
jgi:hypothetical protein